MSTTPPDGPNPGWQDPPSPGPSSWPPAGGTPTPPPAGPPSSFPPPGFPAAGGYPPPGGGVPPGSGYPPAGGGYGGYQPPRDHPQGTTILVLGILSIVCCQLLGPVAWIMGNSAIREIDANPAAYGNRGSVQAGRIIGIVSTVLLLIVVVSWIALIILGSTSSSNGY